MVCTSVEIFQGGKQKTKKTKSDRYLPLHFAVVFVFENGSRRLWSPVGLLRQPAAPLRSNCETCTFAPPSTQYTHAPKLHFRTPPSYPPFPLSHPPSSFAEVRGDPCLNGQRARIIVTDELEGPLLVLGEPRPLHLWCGSWCCVQSFLRRDVFDGAKRNKLHRHGGGVELNCFAMQQHRWRSAVHNT